MQRRRAPGSGGDLAWDDVRLFLGLCRSRTVGEAGKLLGVDASTVSRRLVVLEEALSATLFDRGRDGLAKTAAAEDLLPVAEEIEHAMARFTTAAEGLEREVTGLVRITCPPDVAEVILVPLLPELLERHPALRVEIQPGEALLDLTRREADLALRTVRPARGDLVVTRLATAPWVVAGSAKRAASLGALRAWSDAPWIAWGERMASIPPARWFEQHVSQSAEPVLRSDSLVVQLRAVASGIGVALLPKPSVEHYRLQPIELHRSLRTLAEAWPVDELFLVSHRALRDVPRVHAVWEAIVAAARLGK